MAGRENEFGIPKVTNRTISAENLAGFTPNAAIRLNGDFVPRALEHLRSIAAFNGLPAEFEADPRISKTSSGGVAVHFRQQFKSIPVLMGAQTVKFGAAGALESSTGTAFTIGEDFPVEPRLNSADAVLEAAKNVADQSQSLLGADDDFGNAFAAPSLDVSHFQPKVIATFPEFPPRPTVLEAGPFGNAIKASLIWYPIDGKLVLGWEVILTMPHAAGQYRVIIDASTGKILFRTQLADLLIGRGAVYVSEGPPSARQTVTFPRPWSDYANAFDTSALPPGVPASPADWIDGPVISTNGNLANAHLDEGGRLLNGQNDGGAAVFNPADGAGDDQKILNMFYFNCYLHDVFYLLGFREEDGNFQSKGIGGIANDPVDARAYSGAVWGTANMTTPPDGTSPVMNMGLVEATGRHTAFDASVVFHEYMHGVTNRLVGGPMNSHALEVPQSKAMGEGWGDYTACTLTGKNVVGDWVTAKPQGIRTAPYDDNYPGTFGQIGGNVYNESHRVGEIWCATLLAMNRNLDTRLGAPRGKRLALQLVVDALKLSPANPNMIDMRNAILAALDQKRNASPGLSDVDYAGAKTGIWVAFAKFGMGVRAQSAGADFGNVVEDFTVPAATGEPTPSIAGQPGGQPTSPTNSGGSAPQAGGTVSVQDTMRVAIPDGSETGIVRHLSVNAAGAIKRVTLKVDIAHTYVADLQVALVPPGRPHIVVRPPTFKNTPDLADTYTTDDKLATLVGQPAQGDWVLIVTDTSVGDTGALRSWSLDIELQAGTGTSGFAADGLLAPGAVLTAAQLLAQAKTLVQQLESLSQRLSAAIGLPR